MNNNVYECIFSVELNSSTKWDGMSYWRTSSFCDETQR